MILIDYIEKRMKRFNENPNNFLLFYGAYDIALFYYLNKLNGNVDYEKEVLRKKALIVYYYGALKKAIEENPREEDESEDAYNKKIMYKYFELRKKAFIFLQNKMREDIKVIFDVISIHSIDRDEKIIMELSNPLIWFTRNEI